MLPSRLGEWRASDFFAGRGARTRPRPRPAVLGMMPLLTLEPRVVPTIMYGPAYNPHDGITTTLTEENGEIEAQISLSLFAGHSETVAFASYDNATVNPTATGGTHNLYNQERMDVKTALLLPGCSVTLELDEGPCGTWCDGQMTGTQCDVFAECGDLYCGRSEDQVEDYLAPQNFQDPNAVQRADQDIEGGVIACNCDCSCDDGNSDSGGALTGVLTSLL